MPLLRDLFNSSNAINQAMELSPLGARIVAFAKKGVAPI